jgi:hypothetical protein
VIGTLILLWVIFALTLASCAQPSGDLRRPADEFAAITDCDRMINGEQDAEKRIKWNYVYDTLNRRWLIIDNNTDITGCLLERHRWVASVLPDGRRAVQAPHR